MADQQGGQERGRVKYVVDMLERHKAQLAAALPKHLSVDRMLRLAMTCLRKQPKLLMCDPASLLGAIMEAAQLGLEIGVQGQASLVPFKNRVTLMPGYRGLIALAYRSGVVQSIESHVVHVKDRFTLVYGTEAKLAHEPFLDGDAGSARLVYAFARTKDEGFAYDAMTMKEVEQVRKASKFSDEADSPWQTWPEEMYRKTAVKRLCKYLPTSIELERALELDTQAELGEQTFGIGDVIDVPTLAIESGKSQIDSIADDLRARNQTKGAPAAQPEPAKATSSKPPDMSEEMEANDLEGEEEEPAKAEQKEKVRAICQNHRDVDTTNDPCWKCAVEVAERDPATKRGAKIVPARRPGRRPLKD
jgi:recombination protein RecT